jgi:hypothetical protein
MMPAVPSAQTAAIAGEIQVLIRPVDRMARGMRSGDGC